MQIIRHRVNTSIELQLVDRKFGIEMDIRSFGDKIVVGHDPDDSDGENFNDWLDGFDHGTLVVNVKEEGIETKAISMIEHAGITNYFLLDQSFPFLVKSLNLGFTKTSARFSDYESATTIQSIMELAPVAPDWVWVDCFTGDWSHLRHLESIKEFGLKICLVSPELHGREPNDEIRKIQAYLSKNELDAVCTKFPNLWEQIHD